MRLDSLSAGASTELTVVRRASCRSDPTMCRPPSSVPSTRLAVRSLTCDGRARHAGAGLMSVPGRPFRRDVIAPGCPAPATISPPLVVLGVEHVVGSPPRWNSFDRVSDASTLVVSDQHRIPES